MRQLEILGVLWLQKRIAALKRQFVYLHFKWI